MLVREPDDIMTSGEPSPHIPLPWEGQAYSIKRHGVSVTNCDSEPVQTPGCIQSHGALLVLRPADLSILQASENAEAVLGHSATALLGQSIGRVVGPENEALLGAFLQREPTDRNSLFVFSINTPDVDDPLNVTVHTIDGVAIVEFEASGPSPSDQPNYYALVKKTVAKLQSADSLKAFCNIATDELREITGFDRVMVYQFHEDFHGEVFAESRRPDLPSWLGMHYPAEDVPKPAREVFQKTWCRPVPDISGSIAELVPLVNPDTGKPLEMTYCILRGASVMYTEYLQNIHVTAALTMPIRRGDQLWGLIACHHYSGPKFISYEIKAACEFLARVVSLLYKAAMDREHYTYRLKIEEVHQSLVRAAAAAEELSVLTDNVPSILNGIAAGGAAVLYQNHWFRVGATPTESELNGLATWLVRRDGSNSTKDPVYATHHLVNDYPPGAGFAAIASGILCVRLSRIGSNLLLWFRPEVIQTVSWAGNPHDKPTVPGPHGPRLTPRKSFELFQESVLQRSVPWLAVEVEAAAQLRLLLADLVVSRSERLAEMNAELTRSNEELDAFAYIASHDLKEPLRGIHKYAHLLLEGAALSNDDRQRAEGLMRLTLRMDGMLDSLLHFSRVGRAPKSYEITDLNEVLAEALEMIGHRSADQNTVFVVPRRLPETVCDWIRTREVLVNLLSNALKYNDKIDKHVEIGFIHPEEELKPPGCSDWAATQLILYVKDNGIGIERKFFDQIFKMFKRLHGRDDYGGGSGVGMTIVKKLVEQQRGRVWLDSTPQVGTTVYFTLPSGDDRE